MKINKKFLQNIQHSYSDTGYVFCKYENTTMEYGLKHSQRSYL